MDIRTSQWTLFSQRCAPLRRLIQSYHLARCVAQHKFVVYWSCL